MPRIFERQPLVEAQHQVHALNALAGAAFDQVVGDAKQLAVRRPSLSVVSASAKPTST